MNLRGSQLLKRVDRYAGIPIVAVLGLLPRRRLTRPPNSIGLLRTAAIGDTLLLAGVLDDLRVAFPAADLALVTGRDNAEAGALVAADRCRHVVISVARPLAALRELRAQRFDWLFDTGSWPRIDAILTGLSGARVRIGFRTAGQHRHFAYDIAADHSNAVHETENFRALLRAARVTAGRTPALSRSRLTASVRSTQALVFHPWSGGYLGRLKEWPDDRWVELAIALRPIADRIVVSGGGRDAGRARALVERLSAAGVRAESVAGAFDLSSLASVLCGSRCLVSVNTGVMHLGALLGVPTVSLEGPTPPLRWGPVGDRVATVTTSTPNCGYLDLGFEYEGQRRDCMQGVSAADVATAVRGLLST